VLTGEEKSNGKQDEPSPEFRNFQWLLKGTLSTPKEELDKRHEKYAQEKREKQEKGSSPTAYEKERRSLERAVSRSSHSSFWCDTLRS